LGSILIKRLSSYIYHLQGSSHITLIARGFKIWGRYTLKVAVVK
ncbi:hypothetical protein BAE44_0008359, partial [Dichanthelium oligosanthes]